MKLIHTPKVNARYWTAITLASIFGTNMGDFYAHESGLGIGKGLLLLAVFAAVVFVAERFGNWRTELYYWLVIVIIRTGATNIADYLAFRVRIQPVLLTVGLLVILYGFGWFTHRVTRADTADGPGQSVPTTNAAYWVAMLAAGVFGTVMGDICSHLVGEGVAAIALFALLLAVLALGRGRAAQIILLYWTTVAIARTAGTAIGDWIAENKILNIGLPISTLITGLAFVAVVAFWKTRTPAPLTDPR